MTHIDGRFWRGTFRNVFSAQVSEFCDAVIERLLPTFDSLEAEAEQIAQAKWAELMATADADADPGELAERATDSGVGYLMSMEGVRQALANLSAAALYHLFEQQLLLFHRRQVLHPSEENDIDLLGIDVCKTRLASAGVDVESLPSWEEIEVLRLLANAVKHAEGSFAEKLRRLRPYLFVHPARVGPGGVFETPARHVFMPLAGEDIFVSVETIRHFRDAVRSFWEELGDAID